MSVSTLFIGDFCNKISTRCLAAAIIMMLRFAGVGWGGGAKEVVSPEFQHAPDATLWTFSSSLWRALDATP